MKDSKQLLDQIEQKIAPSPNNSMTEAGQTEPLSDEKKSALIDTINEAFELLRINYQHLYFSAYSEIDAINAAKRLWMENLSQFEPAVISQAIHAIIKHSDYLPTISKMIKQCVKISTGTAMPEVHDAYIEAKGHYESLCERIANGETLLPIKQLALPAETTTPLTKEENTERVKALLSSL